MDGMSILEELFVSIYHSLREMKEKKCEPPFNNKIFAKADSLFKLATDFSFITTLVVTRNILDYLLPVTRKLQTKDSDIAESIDLIKSLKLTIEKLRNNSDLYHTKWYGIAGELASKLDVVEPKVATQRICSKQIYSQNPKVGSNSDYFQVTVTVPLLDHLMSDLEMRFPGDELTAYHGLYIIPYVMFTTPNTWRKEILIFATFHSEDLPSFCLYSELDLWFTHWENLSATTDLPNSVAVTLKLVDSVAFPHVSVSLRLLVTLPVTTCECERSFSSLRHIKTWSRSTMENNRLNGIAL